MNKFQVKHIFLLMVFLKSMSVFSQEKKQTQTDTLQTENVTVIKTFNPTINDAFKIETSVDDNKEKTKPQKVSAFTIKSVPVASTFVPKKAKSIGVKRERKRLPPQNYALLGVGNFGNIQAETFVHYRINRDTKFSALLQHQSSQGNIDDIRVDDFYYDTGLQLSYEKEDRKTPWGLFFEAQHQLYNWYGIPDDLVLSSEALNEIDPSHTFIDLNIGGKITFDTDFIKNIETKLRYFFDDYNSNEINLIAKSHSNFEVNDYNLDLPMELDILAGSFEPENFLPEIKYQIINLGVKPSIPLAYNDIKFKVGVSGYVSADTENKDTDLFIYPNLLATYQFKDLGISVFGGLTGGLTQNTYHNASANNPFVAPLLGLQPTSESYNLHAGVQGNLNEQLSYEVEAFYKSEKDKALFQKNGILNITAEQSNFGFDNAFVYVYDDVKTGSISGNLNYDVADFFKVSLATSFFTYNASNQSEAWNLPQITTTLRGNYIFNEKLDFEGSLFFIGTRKDFDAINNRVEDVDSIFDMNLGANYSITKKWKAFLKAKNITSQNYERWLDYPVQSVQVLGGIKYLFE